MLTDWLGRDPHYIEQHQREIREWAARNRLARLAVQRPRVERHRLRHHLGVALVALGTMLAGPSEPCCAECQ